MNIRIENKHGFSIDIGGNSGMKLLEYPDFGLPKADIQSYKIPGRDGELFGSSNIGVRDITLKAELNLPLCILSKVLVPGEYVKLFIDDKWTIEGRIVGINDKQRPARLAKPVITFIIRCFNPFFSKINSVKTVSFDNHGGGIYHSGDYTYQKFTVYNDGDVPCPVNIEMSCNSALAPSGIFTTVEWNDGNPTYSGVIFKNNTESEIMHFITTDTFSDRFFESRSVLGNCDYFLIPPGKTDLYAQNVTGKLWLEPKFMYVDGRYV